MKNLGPVRAGALPVLSLLVAMVQFLSSCGGGDGKNNDKDGSGLSRDLEAADPEVRGDSRNMDLISDLGLVQDSRTDGVEPDIQVSDADFLGQPSDTDQPDLVMPELSCAEVGEGTTCIQGRLAYCSGGVEVLAEQCAFGCRQTPRPGCAAEGDQFCLVPPPMASPEPPVEICNNMDWLMSPDGFYIISQFGTTWDPTTGDNLTSCGWLQAHYDYYQCIQDSQTGDCLGDEYIIPWIQGWVNYDYDEVVATIASNKEGDVPRPEFFYVADSQRFGCGALLRVSSAASNRCVVVYTEDGGPNGFYETAEKGGRRLLDSSPAVIEYLDIVHHGWSSSELVLVEWALEGDYPGKACTPCESVPAMQGSEFFKPPHNLVHMMNYTCP